MVEPKDIPELEDMDRPERRPMKVTKLEFVAPGDEVRVACDDEILIVRGVKNADPSTVARGISIALVAILSFALGWILS